MSVSLVHALNERDTMPTCSLVPSSENPSNTWHAGMRSRDREYFLLMHVYRKSNIAGGTEETV